MVLTCGEHIQHAWYAVLPPLQRVEMLSSRSPDGALNSKDVKWLAEWLDLRTKTREAARKGRQIATLGQCLERWARQEMRRHTIRPGDEANLNGSHRKQ